MSQSAFPRLSSEARCIVFRCAFCLALCTFSLGLVAQSGTPTNPQDVPQQQAPGTNNPDISKQRRPAPVQPGHGTADTHNADVPQQQPGTNNPDVAKQRGDNGGTSTGTGTSNKKQTGSGRKAKRKSSTASSSSATQPE